MKSPLRVLVVDDSAFMRSAVTRALSGDDRFTVVGQARDGQDAVEQAAKCQPDLVTMDFNMPRMNGAEATRAIMAARPTRIVMLSAHTREGAQETMQALAAGAVDFLQKPDGEVSTNLSLVSQALVQKLLEAGGANPSALGSARAPTSKAETAEPAPVSRRGPRAAARAMPPGLRLVVIASSTGGPSALVRIFPKLAARNVAFLVVQHLPAGFTAALAQQLAEVSPFPVREARDGDIIEAGRALVAPGGKHLIIDRSGRLGLTDTAPVHGVKPAADVTLKSAATAFGARCVGVVLTGMGRDGATGLAAVKAGGGRTLAQDKQTSTVYGMPKAAFELGVVDEAVALDQVASSVARLVT